MALSDLLFGKSEEVMRTPRFTQGQQQGIDAALAQALQGLKPEQFGAGFEPIAQQARTQFEQKTIPSLAERFTAWGGQRSSGFQQSLGQAGAGLEEALAAGKAQFGQQQQGQLQNLLGLGLTQQDELTGLPETYGLSGGLATGFGAGLGSAAAEGGLSSLLSGLGSTAGGLGAAGTAGTLGAVGIPLLLYYLSQRGR